MKCEREKLHQINGISKLPKLRSPTARFVKSESYSGLKPNGVEECRRKKAAFLK